MDPEKRHVAQYRSVRSPRVIGLPRSARGHSIAFGRTVVSVFVALSLAFVAAACGGSPSSNAPGGSLNAGTSTSSGSTSPKLIAYTHCMRSHGVPDFPDPRGKEFPKAAVAQIARSNSRYPTATRACAHLLPAGNNGLTAAQAQQIARDEGKFVRCMRSHGVRNWPDPTLTRGRLVFDPQAAGIDPTSPHISARMKACDDVFPASVGVPPGAGYNPGYGP